MFRLRRPYLLFAGGLLLLEIVIALYVHDGLIRPYAGDTLATILLYCIGRSVLSVRVDWAVGGALLLSYLVEGLQYADLLARLGWQHSRVARIVFGSHFAWGDLLAYSLGAMAVLATEHRIRRGGTFRHGRAVD